MSDDPKKHEGLNGKFKVERLHPSSRGIDHTDCRYFVLDPEHDLLARRALLTYADEAERAGFRELARDLNIWHDRLPALARGAHPAREAHEEGAGR